MCRAQPCAGWQCCLVLGVAIVLALGPALAEVRAQDAVPGGLASIAAAGEPVLLRDQPGYDAAVLAPLSDGSPLEVTGAPVTDASGAAWLPVVAAGQNGYVPAGYVASAPAPAPDAAAAVPVAAPDPAAAAGLPAGAATTTDANLRAEPRADAPVLAVLPQGTSVSVDGEGSNGFVPVTGNGVSGWVADELLSGEAVPAAASSPPEPAASTETAPAAGDDPLLPDPIVMAPDAASAGEPPAQAPEAARGASTGIAWPMAGGEWEVVQGYNTGTHTNRGGFAQYQYSLDWARVDGDTAGQPVFAPVSGEIQWIDRGSGGMLVDAGNGYGVAVFHVTLDRGLTRGGSVERGQRIGEISGPGGDGYMSLAHIDITCWRLTGNGHESAPFTGPNAIAGQEFPDTGGANQHMGATVSP